MEVSMYIAAAQWFQFGQPCHNILQTHKMLLIHLGLHRIQPSSGHEVPEAVGSTAEHTKCQNFPKPNLSCTSIHKSYMLA